jgi:uncharacterized membrane protein
MDGSLGTRFLIDPMGGWPGFALAAALLAGLAAWAYLTTPAPMGRSRRVILWVTRGLAFLLVLIGISRPIALVADPRQERPEVALLVDRSASMLFPSRNDSVPPSGETRAARAGRVVESLTASLSERFQIRVREFDRSVSPPESYDGSVDPDSSGASAPGDAVDALLHEAGETRLAAIVLVTDGAASAGRDLVSVADRLGTPLHAVVVGDSTSRADVQVIGVEAPATAFVGEPLSMTVRVRSLGGPQNVTLALFDPDGKEVARGTQALAGAGTMAEHVFRVTPRAAGTLFYRVAIVNALSPAENALDVNDALHVALNVRRDRLQVLVLEEHLNWDFTFLRRTLERDTTLAYSFLVKPGPDKIHRSGAARIDRFPSSLDELQAFECVVLGDVSREFVTARDLETLATFVQAGGGLLLLGGQRSEGLGRFRGTALERVSPVSLSSPGGAAALPPRLTPLGEANPLVSLHGDMVGNRALWADLPPLAPSTARGPARAGGQVLVELHRGGETYPLVTSGRTGSGRVVVFSAAGAWKWKFLREGLGARDEFYDRFGVGVMRWLSDPESSERIHVQPQRRVFRAGDDVVLAGRILGRNLEPLAGAEVALQLRSGSFRRELAPKWGEAGSVTFPAGALDAGRYTYELVVNEKGSGPTRIEGVFLVERNGPEWWQLASRPEFLRQATDRALGQTVSADDAAELVSRVNTPALASSRPIEVALWNHPVALALLLVLLGIEWWLRRRAGLA